MPNYNLPPQTLRQAVQAYYACVSFVDAQVGRLMAALDELNLSQNTIVVLWSDHGYHLGEHGGVWQKRTLFEQAARAPLIIRAPGTAGRGDCRRVVEFVDIYPTLAELSGIVPPTDLAGRSLMPLLHDPLRPWESSAVTQILRPADGRLPQPVMGRSVRTERYRYTQWAGGQAGEELYDHHADPGEFDNLARAPDEHAQAIMQQLRPLLEARAASQPPPSAYDPAKL